MAFSGDLRVSATLASYHKHPLRSSLSSTKVDYVRFVNGGSSVTEIKRNMAFDGHKVCSKLSSGISGDYKLSSDTASNEAENFLLSAINMNFFERLNLAWKIVFPPPASRRRSNARIAKQRLKMILFSDRCAVSDEAKRLIVNNIVHTLSEFVEIESQDKVQLSLSTDSDIGTVYSVTVPVRRVKPEYQAAEEIGSITNIEYKDTGESSGSVDVRFDFYVPDEKPW